MVPQIDLKVILGIFKQHYTLSCLMPTTIQYITGTSIPTRVRVHVAILLSKAVGRAEFSWVMCLYSGGREQKRTLRPTAHGGNIWATPISAVIITIYEI